MTSRLRWAAMNSLVKRALCADKPSHSTAICPKVAQQVTEKVHHLWSADGIWIKPEIEVPPANTGGDREQVPVEVVLQHRGLSARCPGTHPVGPLAQSALSMKMMVRLSRKAFF